jgi:hypothetical protein
VKTARDMKNGIATVEDFFGFFVWNTEREISLNTTKEIKPPRTGETTQESTIKYYEEKRFPVHAIYAYRHKTESYHSSDYRMGGGNGITPVGRYKDPQ